MIINTKSKAFFGQIRFRLIDGEGTEHLWRAGREPTALCSECKDDTVVAGTRLCGQCLTGGSYTARSLLSEISL